MEAGLLLGLLLGSVFLVGVVLEALTKHMLTKFTDFIMAAALVVAVILVINLFTYGLQVFSITLSFFGITYASH